MNLIGVALLSEPEDSVLPGIFSSNRTSKNDAFSKKIPDTFVSGFEE